VSTLPTRECRRSKRTAVKKRASLVFKHGRQHERTSCLILDSSPDGFRLRGTARLRRGQVVEVILDEEPMGALQCNVIWVGKPESKNEGEVGLQVVSR
jgi:hypothetical protein